MIVFCFFHKKVAKVLGARVIATCGSDEKCEIAKRLGGADFTINYSKENWVEKVKEYTNDEGVDVVYGSLLLPHFSALLPPKLMIFLVL